MRYFFIQKNIFLLSLWVWVFFASAAFVSAATLSFSPQQSDVAPGEKITLTLLLDPEEENINALEGTLLASGGVLELLEVRDGGSIVNFWAEKPHMQDGVLSFAGVIPGGFEGTRAALTTTRSAGRVFTLVFRAKEMEGVETITLSHMMALRNDGEGSEVSVATLPASVRVGRASVSTASPLEDRTPPESFVPEIAQDENLFEGKHFLVFRAQDKGSGVNRYEVCETRHTELLEACESGWKPAESPYVLHDQKLSSIIKVKAIDRMGNIRIATLSATKGWLSFETLRFFEYIFTLVLLVVLLLFLLRLQQKAKKHDHEIS